MENEREIASAKNYAELYTAIFPLVLSVVKKHDGELISKRSNDCMRQEFEQIKEFVLSRSLLPRYMINIAMRSTIHAAVWQEYETDYECIEAVVNTKLYGGANET